MIPIYSTTVLYDTEINRKIVDTFYIRGYDSQKFPATSIQICNNTAEMTFKFNLRGSNSQNFQRSERCIKLL